MLLNEDRFFNPEPSVRKIARELYESVKDLPIISPHGHTDPSWFAENQPFPDPTGLILIPDHYVFRMLHSQGITMESLGIPTIDGTPVETDHRKIWQVFGDHFYLFAGTPSSMWLQHEFSVVFGIEEKLNSDSAMRIYDQIQEKLNSPEFLPRALFDRFNIEVLSTTDAAQDDLRYHKQIQESDWNGRVVPCFRPDNVTVLSTLNWKKHVEDMGKASNITIDSYSKFIEALENRRAFFKETGAVSTDHAVVHANTHQLSDQEAETLFNKALNGDVTQADSDTFAAHMLMEMARMSVEDGLVMQIHAGCLRNHNQKVFKRFGADKGCDIPVRTEYTQNLVELLNAYGNNPDFRVIVFTMDETTYARELAPLAGHYPAMKLGPAWWFHDSIQGMIRFRQRATETAGIYNTVGFNDDTRAFPSIPARHDLSRRVDCNFLAEIAAKHIIDMDDARKMAKALAYDLAKQGYKL